MEIRRLEKPYTHSVRAMGVLSVLAAICGVAVVIGCAQRKVTAPEVSSPPAFALQQPLPKPPPPPPDERETEALPLDSENCAISDTLLIDFTRAEVLARCNRSPPTTRVIVTVVPRTTDPADYLRGFSLRFCGEVLDARGPSGWGVEIRREKGRSDVAAYVTWERPDAAAPAEYTSVQSDWRLRGEASRTLAERGGFRRHVRREWASRLCRHARLPISTLVAQDAPPWLARCAAPELRRLVGLR